MTQLPRTTATGRGYLRRFADTEVYVYLRPDKPGNGVSRTALDRLLADGLVELGDRIPRLGRAVLNAGKDDHA
ncbi:hypothetical protein [Streptacidiphilus sp. MAP5-3]|uniref:hypothetical protein n=1 Tax=unclassified Streptacidiphilus TaxID=2643834 RepID=UPI003516C33C